MSLAHSGSLPDLGLAEARRPAPNPWILPWLARGGRLRWAAANLAVACLYAGLGAVVGRFFGAYGLFPAPIWLPAGIAAIACMVGGAGLLPGIFLGSLVVNAAVFDIAPPVAAMISASNALGPWAGVQLTRAMRPASGLFTRFSGVLGFILGAVLLHAACTAAGGTLALALAQPMSLAEAYAVFSAWWLCDSGGTFFFAPALLLWLGVERTAAASDRRPSLADTLVLAGMVATAAALFAVPGLGRLVRPDAVFLLTVPLSWITLRISLRAAYTLLTLICVAATVGTVMGEGPFHGPGVHNPLQSVGLMTVLFAMDALTLIALTSERREAEARLTEARGTLARAVARTEDLTREALTDPLTGVGNRRHFSSAGGAAFYLSRQGGTPLALLHFDLDHFKRLNDSAGHAAGDAALRAVAVTCGHALRADDRVFRLGGEEFAVVLPGLGLAAAAEAAERLRQAIGYVALPGGRRMSASFGVTERGPQDRSLDDLLRRADAATYAAKSRGRDRIEVAAAG
ncbi:diguanylate cyclase [Paeniroseomonas aquatica]|uniref:diguanylate cyclase n=1 Tax=Paeniroseomonas aquatica TaxID=373043 RepID=A0ABT8A4P3_9PROT|nr:diguanylate cyclase [Paeniroseomonas aquatica]MDN3564648.1 diguanylate cyclase [Paeniroseomonas aquatica]